VDRYRRGRRRRGAGPLAQAFVDTAQPLDRTRASVEAKVSSFDGSGHSVVPVPPKPDKPNPCTTGLKAAIPIAGPFMAANDLDSYHDGVAKHNAANDNNVRVTDQYSNVTASTKPALPTDFGVLQSGGAAIAVKQPGSPGTSSRTPRRPHNPSGRTGPPTSRPPRTALRTGRAEPVQRPVSGSGELYAGRRDEVGRYTRLEQPLHYADTDRGRYLNYTTGSGDDAEIHVGPGSSAVLAALRYLGSTLAG